MNFMPGFDPDYLSRIREQIKEVVPLAVGKGRDASPVGGIFGAGEDIGPDLVSGHLNSVAIAHPCRVYGHRDPSRSGRSDISW